MKLMKEIVIVFGFYYLGEILKAFTGLPLPGNLIGMLLLFASLCFNLVKLEQIETLSDYLLQNLSFFFIPAGVGILTSYQYVSDVAIEFLLICVISTFIVMVISGVVIQFYLNKREEI